MNEHLNINGLMSCIRKGMSLRKGHKKSLLFPFIIIIASGIFTGVKWRKVKKNFPGEMFPEGKGQEAIPTTCIKRKKYILEIIQDLL